MKQNPNDWRCQRMWLCNPVRGHGEVHLGRAPGALVPHEAAAQGVDEAAAQGVGGRAEPIPASEEELPAGAQVVGARDGARPAVRMVARS